MESLAKAARVTPLTDFFSLSAPELAGLLEDHLIPEYAASKAIDAWFPPEEGLRTVETLLEVLARQSAPENPKLVEELMEFRQVLESAQARKVRWHLGIDY